MGRAGGHYQRRAIRVTLIAVIASNAATAATRYALASPAFRFPALAALAGRAPLGGGREVALACFLAARLAAAMLPRTHVAAPQRVTRATAARAWLSTLTIPAATRLPVSRVIDATAGDDTPAAAVLLGRMIELATPHLDRGARDELAALAASLAQARPLPSVAS